MRRPRRRPVYYTVSAMYDGTVLAARPIRKPTARSMKDVGSKLGADNVCIEWLDNYVGAFKSDDEGRFRFFDIMANRLNTRRAIRELIQPQVEVVQQELAAIREQLAQIESRLNDKI
jgi:hypothetical protein